MSSYLQMDVSYYYKNKSCHCEFAGPLFSFKWGHSTFREWPEPEYTAVKRNLNETGKAFKNF